MIAEIVVESIAVARLHSIMLFTLLLVLAILAMWALLTAWRNHHMSDQLRAGLWIAELLLLAEFGIGVILWWQGVRPARPETHVIYGIAAVAMLPLTLAWMRGREPRQVCITIGLMCIFVCAIVLRALQTARLS
jgi:hypothetical protein